jgi:hypothetical protein
MPSIVLFFDTLGLRDLSTWYMPLGRTGVLSGPWENLSLTISLPIMAYSRTPAGWFWKKLHTRSSARLASSYVGDPTGLTGDVFSDLGRGGVSEETISPESDKTGERLFAVFDIEVVLEIDDMYAVRLVKEAVAFLSLRIKRVVLLLKFALGLLCGTLAAIIRVWELSLPA